MGTNPLPMKGSRTSGMSTLLAVSTLLLTWPRATANHTSANVTAARKPAVASHPPSPAVGRKPTSSATPITITRPSAAWIMLPSTCPVSTETRAMCMVRNRAMMPSVMSMAIEIEVPWTVDITVISRIVGTT
nr:hypothetical protein GCM10020092_089990 [Actinoplanes digitatis]